MIKTRAFIAINLPKHIKQELNKWLENIKGRFNGNIKWVSAGNLHLTLHFLGYLDEQRLENIKHILKNNVQKHKLFFNIKDIGCFPNKNRARVLFMQCNINNDYLKDLQEKLKKEITNIGIKTDNRPWHMHITFARLIKPNKLLLSKFSKLKNIGFEVESIDLMKSEIRRTGPIYTVLESFSLL